MERSVAMGDTCEYDTGIPGGSSAASITCYNGGTCKVLTGTISGTMGLGKYYYGKCDCACGYSGKNCKKETGKCCTISGGYGTTTSSPCVFPFKFEGYTFDSCTFYKATNTGQQQGWCATKVDSENNYVSGNWGHCSLQCPKEYEMCSNGYKEGTRSLAPKGTKCKSETGKNPCIYDEGIWGKSYCITSHTSNTADAWGAECVPCQEV